LILSLSFVEAIKIQIENRTNESMTDCKSQYTNTYNIYNIKWSYCRNESSDAQLKSFASVRSVNSAILIAWRRAVKYSLPSFRGLNIKASSGPRLRAHNRPSYPVENFKRSLIILDASRTDECLADDSLYIILSQRLLPFFVQRNARERTFVELQIVTIADSYPTLVSFPKSTFSRSTYFDYHTSANCKSRLELYVDDRIF